MNKDQDTFGITLPHKRKNRNVTAFVIGGCALMAVNMLIILNSHGMKYLVLLVNAIQIAFIVATCWYMSQRWYNINFKVFCTADYIVSPITGTVDSIESKDGEKIITINKDPIASALCFFPTLGTVETSIVDSANMMRYSVISKEAGEGEAPMKIQVTHRQCKYCRLFDEFWLQDGYKIESPEGDSHTDSMYGTMVNGSVEVRFPENMYQANVNVGDACFGGITKVSSTTKRNKAKKLTEQ